MASRHINLPHVKLEWCFNISHLKQQGIVSQRRIIVILSDYLHLNSIEFTKVYASTDFEFQVFELDLQDILHYQQCKYHAVGFAYILRYQQRRCHAQMGSGLGHSTLSATQVSHWFIIQRFRSGLVYGQYMDYGVLLR